MAEWSVALWTDVIMASKVVKPRAQRYTLLTDVQRNILKRYFENGMIGTGQQHQEQIAQAAEEADLSKNQVGVGLSSLSW